MLSKKLVPIILTRPFWLPKADGLFASNFADYRTEGTINRYWNNNTKQLNFATWWASRGTGSTFARASASNGTTSTGLLTLFNSNVPVIPVVDPSNISKGLGMQYEGARTNVLLQSNAFSNASWSTSTIGTPAQNVAGPDGTTSAWTITPSAGSGSHALFQSITASGATNVSIQIQAKASAGRYLLVNYQSSAANYISAVFDLLGGAANATQTSVGSTSGTISSATLSIGPNGFMTAKLVGQVAGANGFVLYAIAPTATGNTFATSGQISWSAAGTETLVIADAQAEVASFPSSYITTTTGSASRAADSQTLTRTAPTSITKVIAGRTPNVAAASAGQPMMFNLKPSGVSGLQLYWETNGKLVLFSSGGGSATSAQVLPANTHFVVAIQATSTGGAISVNGETPISTGSSVLVANSTIEWEGQFATGAEPWYSTIKGTAEWTNYAASNAALQALSGSSYWN